MDRNECIEILQKLTLAPIHCNRCSYSSCNSCIYICVHFISNMTTTDIGECEGDDKRISLDTLDGKTVYYSPASPSTARNTNRAEDLVLMLLNVS